MLHVWNCGHTFDVRTTSILQLRTPLLSRHHIVFATHVIIPGRVASVICGVDQERFQERTIHACAKDFAVAHETL
eukprot:763951-Amphidinium_carterae.2